MYITEPQDNLYCLTDIVEAVQAFHRFLDLATRQSALDFYRWETGINKAHLVAIANLLSEQEAG